MKTTKVAVKKATAKQTTKKHYLVVPSKTMKHTKAGLYFFLLSHPTATMKQLQEAAAKQRGIKNPVTEREVKIFLPRVAKIFAKTQGKEIVRKGSQIILRKAA